VNDVLVQGAEPLFFLDYYATGRLSVPVAAEVVRGIAAGCEPAGCALIGGETAEMPGMYAEGEYDLAGFCVGVVEKSQVIDGSSVAPGDCVVGLASSGLHSNGYSLARRIVEHAGARLDQPFAGRTLGDALLEPTRIYVRAVRALLAEVPVRAIAHITGGGLPGNLPRVLPAAMAARLDAAAWSRPALFDWLQSAGQVADDEMYRTFNCGIGMALVVPESDARRTIALLEAAGERAMPIGRIEARAVDADAVLIG
jgi:phosphoribosylformylglycinamidine cyclo-ligase